MEANSMKVTGDLKNTSSEKLKCINEENSEQPLNQPDILKILAKLD